MGYTPLFSVESWITQYFGPSANYAAGYHEGIDLVPKDRKNWALYAPADGVVKWAGWGDTYGNNMILWCREIGMSFRFCHLDSIVVDEGHRAREGALIAIGGNTGRSSGRHLHLNAVPMTRYGDKDFPGNGTNGRVDPLGVLRVLGVWI